MGGGQLLFRLLGVVLPTLCPLQSSPMSAHRVALPEPSWAVGLWRRLQSIFRACPQMTSHLPNQSPRGRERCLSREVRWLRGPGFTGQGSVRQPGSLEERPGGAHPMPPSRSGPWQLPETEPTEVTGPSREEATRSPGN